MRGVLSFADVDLARLLVALAVLLIAAHGMGSLFARFGQPPAIGEIVGASCSVPRSWL
jgi:Kef-type K+ transport system membrane component KefB